MNCISSENKMLSISNHTSVFNRKTVKYKEKEFDQNEKTASLWFMFQKNVYVENSKF